MDAHVPDPRLNVLVVHGDVPPPDRDACSIRLLRIVELLIAEGHRVTFLARGGTEQPHNTARLLEMGVAEVFPLDPLRLSERFPDQNWRWTIEMLDLDGLLRRGRFDVAWLSLYDVAEQYAPLIRRHSPSTRIIVDSTDIAWVRERRGAQLTGDPAAGRGGAAHPRTRACRLRQCRPLRRHQRGRRPGHPRARPGGCRSRSSPSSSSSERVAADRTGRAGLLFVGNFWHAPNVDAVAAFHRDTWPTGAPGHPRHPPDRRRERAAGGACRRSPPTTSRSPAGSPSWSPTWRRPRLDRAAALRRRRQGQDRRGDRRRSAGGDDGDRHRGHGPHRRRPCAGRRRSGRLRPPPSSGSTTTSRCGRGWRRRRRKRWRRGWGRRRPAWRSGGRCGRPARSAGRHEPMSAGSPICWPPSPGSSPPAIPPP